MLKSQPLIAGGEIVERRQVGNWNRRLLTRRDLIALLGGGVAAWPALAHAQPAGPARVIGVLLGYASSNPAAQSRVAAFRDALAKLGWTEGHNLRIELRWAEGNADRIGTLAKELVDLRPDAIFGSTTPVVDALARATRTIPIVFVVVSDPVGSGFASSLAHPGGNVTGFTAVESEMGGKWVELLKEIAPGTQRMALLYKPDSGPPLEFHRRSIAAAAASFGVGVSVARVASKDEVESVIAALARTPGNSLIVMPGAFYIANNATIIALAAHYGVPAVYPDPLSPKSGGLIGYGIDFVGSFRQAAGYFDRIFKGAKPGELPIQQPTKFELVINLKAAKALGLTVSPALLAAADEVIE